MDEAINWTVEELVTLYQLHPELCDVFVEGDADQGLIDWFLNTEGHNNVSVYPVSVVTIPASLVVAYGLEHPSRRSEVVALALELEKWCSAEIRPTCVADADYARFGDGITIPSALILLTDYTSMEMYAFKPAVVQKLLKVVHPRFKLSGQEVLDRIKEILQTLFALRLASRELGLGLAWLSFDRCAKLAKGSIVFDLDEFVRRYLNTRGRMGDADAFRKKLDEIERKFQEDVRNQIRGHDFVEVLSWFLTKSSKLFSSLKPEVVKHLLAVQLTREELRQEGLFKALLERTAAHGVPTQ